MSNTKKLVNYKLQAPEAVRNLHNSKMPKHASIIEHTSSSSPRETKS